MACFLVPTAEAIVTSAVEHRMAKKEEAGEAPAPEPGKISIRQKLSWLNGMLWGGAILLCLEHIWHGEVVLYPPFLTAMGDPADTAVMLHEMATVGVSMALLITAVWVIMVLIVDHIPAIKSAFGLDAKPAKEA